MQQNAVACLRLAALGVTQACCECIIQRLEGRQPAVADVLHSATRAAAKIDLNQIQTLCALAFRSLDC